MTETSTTTVTPTVFQPKVCNASGTPKGQSNYDTNFNSGGQADCIANCKLDTRCLSTGYYTIFEPSNGNTYRVCRYFSQPVAGSANLGSGSYTFNDKAC